LQYENVRKVLEKKVKETEDLPPLGCNIFAFVRFKGFQGNTGYAITYHIWNDIKIIVKKYDSVNGERSYDHVETIIY
jgi:hypothetical protein